MGPDLLLKMVHNVLILIPDFFQKQFCQRSLPQIIDLMFAFGFCQIDSIHQDVRREISQNVFLVLTGLFFIISVKLLRVAMLDHDQQGCFFQSIAELRADVNVKMYIIHTERKPVQRIINQIRLERQVF